MEQAYDLRRKNNANSGHKVSRYDSNVDSGPSSSNNFHQLEPSLRDLILRPKSKGIARPPNAFMIFARENRKKLAVEYPKQNNKRISSFLGERWRQLDPDGRRQYFVKAKMLEDLHKQQYPGYVYNPRIARMKKLERVSKSKRKVRGSSPISDTERIKSEPIHQDHQSFHNIKVEGHWNDDVFEEKDVASEYVPNNPEYFSPQQSEQVPYTPQSSSSFWNSTDQVYPFDQASPWVSTPYDNHCPTPCNQVGMRSGDPLDSHYTHNIRFNSCEISCDRYSSSAYRSTSTPSWKSRQVGYFNDYSGMYQMPEQGEFTDFSSTNPRKVIEFHPKVSSLPYGSNTHFQKLSHIRPELEELANLQSSDPRTAIRFQPKNYSLPCSSNAFFQQPSPRSYLYGPHPENEQQRWSWPRSYYSLKSSKAAQYTHPKMDNCYSSDYLSVDCRNIPAKYSYNSNLPTPPATMYSGSYETSDNKCSVKQEIIDSQPVPYSSEVFQPKFDSVQDQTSDDEILNIVDVDESSLSEGYAADEMQPPLSHPVPYSTKIYQPNSYSGQDQTSYNGMLNHICMDESSLSVGYAADEFQSPLPQPVPYSSEMFRPNLPSGHDKTSDDEILNIVDVNENSCSEVYAVDGLQKPLSIDKRPKQEINLV